MRKLVYYVAVSADGFIADPAGDTSMFPAEPETLAHLFGRYPETCPHHLRGVLGVPAKSRRFDTVLMGFRTHEPALAAGLTSAYPHLRQVVLTHRELPPDPTVETWSGDALGRVRDLKREEGADIWLCGGGSAAAQLIDEIDEVQLKINPVTLGSGVRLFGGAPPRSWVRRGVEEVPGGVTLLTLDRAEQ